MLWVHITMLGKDFSSKINITMFLYDFSYFGFDISLAKV